MPLRHWRWWPWARSRRTLAPTAKPAAPRGDRFSQQSASGLTLAEATELLDLLERQGLEPPDVEVGPDGRVTVRWIGPSAKGDADVPP